MALERGGGSFSTIKDVKGQNPADTSREISYSRDAQRKQAVELWLAKSRAAQGGKADLQAELDFLMDRGIKHPEVEKVFNEAYSGFLSTNVAGKPATDRVPRIVELGDEYIRIAERNWAFAQDLVANDARDFYETYRVLRQFAGRSPEVAAGETAMAFSNPATARDPAALLGNQRRIEDTINAMDIQRWWCSGAYAFLAPTKKMTPTWTAR